MGCKELEKREMELKLYEVLASYRGTKNATPYYVKAMSKKHAATRFRGICTWMTVYGVTEVEPDKAADILANRYMHVVFS